MFRKTRVSNFVLVFVVETDHFFESLAPVLGARVVVNLEEEESGFDRTYDATFFDSRCSKSGQKIKFSLTSLVKYQIAKNASPKKL